MKHETGRSQGDELRETARRSSSMMAAFRMLSGRFRARVASALDLAARQEDERALFDADRAALDETLSRYHGMLESSRARLEELATNATTTLHTTSDTQRRVLDVQERALQLEGRTRELADEDQRLIAIAEGLARTQQEARDLLGRVESDLVVSSAEVVEAREAHTAAARRAAEIQVLLGELEEKQRELAQREGAIAAREQDQSRHGVELSERDTALVVRTEHLTAVLDALREEGSRLSGVSEIVAARSVQAERLQGDLSLTLAGTQERERLLDQRAAALEMHAKELDELRLAQDRERVELDSRIQRLSDLEERDEQLLQVKSHLDDEKRRLDAAFQEIRGQQNQTIETWDQLKETLQRLETLEGRVQVTHEDARKVRDETAAQARQREASLADLQRRLDERAKQLEVWRMEAQLRERRIQQRFNELDELETKKERVRDEIADLEREQAQRFTAFETSREAQQRVWGERRAEAEKARELYERNCRLLERRIAEVDEREGEHEKRARELQGKTLEIERRERRLRAAEARVRELEEQRQSLNATIASLTASAAIPVIESPAEAAEG